MTTGFSEGRASRGLYFSLTILTLAILGACGGDRDRDSDSDEGGSSATVTGQNAVATMVRSLAAGADCPNGGIAVDTGIDTNTNGVLDPAEVTGTQSVCHGASGTDGLSTLVSIGNEAPGTHCATGGSRVDTGKDVDASGTLDAGEISSTGYICHGAAGANGTNGKDGANGTNGTNGINTLIALTSEPAGGNCTHGGQKLESGLDDDPANGTLDAVEVSTTTYVCNGAGVLWVRVTGTAQQGEPNTGYMADNAGQVTITLPTSPTEGDIVQVSGIGAGGWTIAQNPGQNIVAPHILGNIGTSWSAHGPVLNWGAIASSADGRKLVAAQTNWGQLYTSTDFGETWTGHGPVLNWQSVSSSADGSKLVAAANHTQIFTSTDSGQIWTARESARPWVSVASSADGSKLVAAAVGDQLYISTDSGATWTAREAIRSWASVASSADGSRLVAAEHGGQVYTSADGGVTWTARGPTRDWQSVASSADGGKLVAADRPFPLGGQIHTSTDAGATWTAHAPTVLWQAVASSADGSKLVAAADNQLYTSADSGATWTVRHSASVWQALASSADGSRLVAAEWGGQIHTSAPTLVPPTSVGTAGSISGGQHDAIELQYIGSGTFMVRNHSGYLRVQ